MGARKALGEEKPEQFLQNFPKHEVGSGHVFGAVSAASPELLLAGPCCMLCCVRSGFW